MRWIFGRMESQQEMRQIYWSKEEGEVKGLCLVGVAAEVEKVRRLCR